MKSILKLGILLALCSNGCSYLTTMSPPKDSGGYGKWTAQGPTIIGTMRKYEMKGIAPGETLKTTITEIYNGSYLIGFDYSQDMCGKLMKEDGVFLSIYSVKEKKNLINILDNLNERKMFNGPPGDEPYHTTKSSNTKYKTLEVYLKSDDEYNVEFYWFGDLSNRKDMHCKMTLKFIIYKP